MSQSSSDPICVCESSLFFHFRPDSFSLLHSMKGTGLWIATVLPAKLLIFLKHSMLFPLNSASFRISMRLERKSLLCQFNPTLLGGVGLGDLVKGTSAKGGVQTCSL